MDTVSLTTQGVEFRADARSISGPVVVYADTARTRRGLEKIAPGAMLGLTDPAFPVSFQHRMAVAERITTYGDGLLTFTDGPTALRANLVVPDGDVGTRAIEGVRKGELTGWSSEFLPLMEANEGGVNTVFRAFAVGLGLVDTPAYSQSLVELRQASERSVLLTGPPGAGKSARARELREQTPRSVVADFQLLYAAALGLRRNEGTGRFPERQESDAHALGLAEGMRVALISMAARDGVSVITTNSSGDLARRQSLLTLMGQGSTEEVLDPGRAEVERRLAGPDGLSDQCEQAIRRYYDSLPRRTGPRRRDRRLAWL